jgi:hypothetical protein
MKTPQNNTMNNTVYQQLVWDMTRKTCNTPTAVLALISIILNSLIVVTFFKERKTNRKLSCGSVQLLILAFSDVAIGVWWASGFVDRLLIENQLLSKNLTGFHVFWVYGWITAYINRVLTLYIRLVVQTNNAIYS